jgi:hypothetical protein
VAHFAKLDDNGVVETITVLKNEIILDTDGNESEAIGNEFLNSIGMTGTWVQCSYNLSFRGMFPHPGAWFDAKNDRFLNSPSPFPSWTFNESKMEWEPPVSRPEDGLTYMWIEGSQTWEAVTE